jgi:hypothetical protein
LELRWEDKEQKDKEQKRSMGSKGKIMNKKGRIKRKP